MMNPKYQTKMFLNTLFTYDTILDTRFGELRYILDNIDEFKEYKEYFIDGCEYFTDRFLRFKLWYLKVLPPYEIIFKPDIFKNKDAIQSFMKLIKTKKTYEYETPTALFGLARRANTIKENCKVTILCKSELQKSIVIQWNESDNISIIVAPGKFDLNESYDILYLRDLYNITKKYDKVYGLQIVLPDYAFNIDPLIYKELHKKVVNMEQALDLPHTIKYSLITPYLYPDIVPE